MAFTSHDGQGYPVQSLGQDGCSMDYVVWLLGMWAGLGGWNMDWALAVSLYWQCHFTGSDLACETSYNGHDHLSWRLDTGFVIQGALM